MASQWPQGSMHHKDGYAAIDFGSTSTRAYLTTVDIKTNQMHGYRVQMTGVDDDKKKRFLRGEWPSKGCPFDAPYPVGYEAAGKEHVDKRDRSLKSFVWFLADDDDRHPYTKDLWEYYNTLPGGALAKQQFKKRLKKMLVRHLTVVADQILNEAILRQTTIRRLVLCVPNAWDKPAFQKVLRPIMDKVSRGVETYCVFESEALSQYLLHEHPYLLVDYDFVLVCDFGGHFMGGSLFQFARDGPEDDHPAFFCLPQGNFGIRGGSQLWEDYIRPIIDVHLSQLDLPVDRASVLRTKFLDAFFISKIDVDESFYERNMPLRLVVSITDTFPDDNKLYHLHLRSSEIAEAWESAFRESINLAIQKIRLIPQSARRTTFVILSGGSMQNHQARTEILKVCEQRGIACRAVGFDVNVESSKWMVCEGAATSEACAMSVRDFFHRGAAVAVQSYTCNGDYETNAQVLFYGAKARETVGSSWNAQSGVNSGQYFEYDIGRPVSFEIGGIEDNRIKLVCDPLYQSNSHRYPNASISILPDDAAANNNCYDIWDVSRSCEEVQADGKQVKIGLQPGRYVIEVDGMEYNDNKSDATLHLQLTRQVDTGDAAPPVRLKKNLRARTLQQYLSPGDMYTFSLPLTSCGPSNLVLLDLDLVKDRVWNSLQPAAKRQRMASFSADGGAVLYEGWDILDPALSAQAELDEDEDAMCIDEVPPETIRHSSLQTSATSSASPQPVGRDRHTHATDFERGSSSDFDAISSVSSVASIPTVKEGPDPMIRTRIETYDTRALVPALDSDGSDCDNCSIYDEESTGSGPENGAARKPSKPWNDADIDRMVREKAAGYTNSEIAHDLHRSHASVAIKYGRVMKEERWQELHDACAALSVDDENDS